MRFETTKDFLQGAGTALAKGPVALIFAEDPVEVDTCLAHHDKFSFAHMVVFAPPYIEISQDLETPLSVVTLDPGQPGVAVAAVNAVIKAAPGIWLYYCFNAEYLFFPFCEQRTIGEMTAFAVEERRFSIMTYVVDLYARDLKEHPTGVNLKSAHLDRSGYYALARTDRWNNPLERQMDFFGGLRWRFEEHIPQARRRIDRVAIFRAKAGLTLSDDHTFSDPEYNTYACPWHHSPTAAIASFRTAKALKRNPGSAHEIDSFRWHNSTAFEWNSAQLLDLGLMEPGQWF